MRRRYARRRPREEDDADRPAPLALTVSADDTNADLVRQALPRLLAELAMRDSETPSEMLFYLGASLVAVLLRCRASDLVEELLDDRSLCRAIRRNLEQGDYARFGPVILVCAHHACTTADWPDTPGLAISQERLEQIFWQALSPVSADRFRQLPALDDWHFATELEGVGKERRLACTCWAKVDSTSPPGPLS